MDGGDAWVMMSTAPVLFMVPGLALFYGGMGDRTEHAESAYGDVLSA